MNALTEGARPGTLRWLATGLGSLAVAYALTLLVVALANANGYWFSTPASIDVAGARFDVVRGSGHRDGDALVLESADASGVAVVSARVTPFSAEDYPRIEWAVESTAYAPPPLTLLWRTKEKPGKSFSRPLEWDSGSVRRVVPLQIADSGTWNGTIVGVALVVRGPMPVPLTIGGVTLPGVSAAASIMEVLGQWSRPFTVQGGSITYPFDKERNDHLPLLLATVVAQGLAIAAFAMAARRRRDRIDSRVVWTILVAGWLVLDVRWQINLGRELVHTAERFAGKSGDERHLASDDAPLFALMQRVNGALPPPPARIFVLAGTYSLRARSAFFLYPHNVNYNTSNKGIVLYPGMLAKGNFVLLFPGSGIGYDRERRLLTWPDGQTREAKFMLEGVEGALLLEIT